jgi:hypothetical protein
MAAGHKIGETSQGRKDPEHGTNLFAFVANQGVPDRRLVFTQAEGRSHEGMNAVYTETKQALPTPKRSLRQFFFGWHWMKPS